MTDKRLCEAVAEMARGLIDADLGGNVYKKRVALPGRGKSGSTRTLIASNLSSRWVFMYGFEKNDRDNIGESERMALAVYAASVLALSDSEILKVDDLTEVHCEQT